MTPRRIPLFLFLLCGVLLLSCSRGKRAQICVPWYVNGCPTDLDEKDVGLPPTPIEYEHSTYDEAVLARFIEHMTDSTFTQPPPYRDDSGRTLQCVAIRRIPGDNYVVLSKDAFQSNSMTQDEERLVSETAQIALRSFRDEEHLTAPATIKFSYLYHETSPDLTCIRFYFDLQVFVYGSEPQVSDSTAH